MPGMWARLQADLNVQLRRGAWYRITQLGPLQAVVEVRGQRLEVPSAFLQVVDSPPRTWSVVARPSDAVHLPRDWGDRYAVCPSCRGRPSIAWRPAAHHGVPALQRRVPRDLERRVSLSFHSLYSLLTCRMQPLGSFPRLTT